MNRLLLPTPLRDRVDDHLAAAAPNEEGLFLLFRQGVTENGVRLVAFDAVLAQDGSWERQGASELTPSGQWLSAVLSRASAASAGLVLVHSHPHPLHPAGLSAVDLATFRRLAPAIEDVTDHPFGMLAVSSRGWSGVVSAEGLPQALQRVDTLGPGLHPLAPSPAVEDVLLDNRQILALGPAHEDLRSLSVAIVGCGGTGSAVAEQVYRMGVAEVVLVDHDTLDTESNLRRISGARYADAHVRPAPAKVDVVAEHLAAIALPETKVVALRGDVRDEAVCRRLLDCDLIICATDTHSSRGLLNDLAFAYALPVIDVGARVSARAGELEGLVVDRRVLLPGRPCLWCTGEIRQDTIRAENLSDDERRALEAEGYVAGSLAQPQASIIALNALAAAAASCTIPALLGDAAECLPDRTVFDAVLGDARSNSFDTAHGCRCTTIQFEADAAQIGMRREV